MSRFSVELCETFLGFFFAVRVALVDTVLDPGKKLANQHGAGAFPQRTKKKKVYKRGKLHAEPRPDPPPSSTIDTEH